MSRLIFANSDGHAPETDEIPEIDNQPAEEEYEECAPGLQEMDENFMNQEGATVNSMDRNQCFFCIHEQVEIFTDVHGEEHLKRYPAISDGSMMEIAEKIQKSRFITGQYEKECKKIASGFNIYIADDLNERNRTNIYMKKIPHLCGQDVRNHFSFHEKTPKSRLLKRFEELDVLATDIYQFGGMFLQHKDPSMINKLTKQKKRQYNVKNVKDYLSVVKIQHDIYKALENKN
jgi:hypothetical protein